MALVTALVVALVGRSVGEHLSVRLARPGTHRKQSPHLDQGLGRNGLRGVEQVGLDLAGAHVLAFYVSLKVYTEWGELGMEDR